MPVAIEYFGAQAVGSYLLEEAGETAFEAATGIPVIIDPVDIVEQGVKKGGMQYTKSNLKIGQQMHKSYKIGSDGIKEFRLPSGKRIDFLDLNNSTIYELKPFNPRAMKAGHKQLDIYKQELQTMPQFRNVEWKTILDTY